MQVGASLSSNIFSGASFSIFQRMTLESKEHEAIRLDFYTLPLLSVLICHEISTMSYSCSQYCLSG